MAMKFVFASAAAVALLSFDLVHNAVAAPVSAKLQNILKNTDKSTLYGYPTDLTRDIAPIPVHSHNDYWREIPFYSGLAAGCISTEADVWLYNDTLYVGHDQSSLTKDRTLQSLYIDPILDTLKRANPSSEFVFGPTKNGVFDTDPFQTLYLFIDLKTAGSDTWPVVLEALQPLRDAGYLTTLKNNETLLQRPVTVIGTGNTPFELVSSVAHRDYFFDGPLADLDAAEYAHVTNLISPIASTSLAQAVGEITSDGDEPLNSTQLDIIRKQISTAKSRGIGARYWETPGWPIRKRNQVWRTLLNEGVALLNVDDLEAVGEYF